MLDDDNELDHSPHDACHSSFTDKKHEKHAFQEINTYNPLEPGIKNERVKKEKIIPIPIKKKKKTICAK